MQTPVRRLFWGQARQDGLVQARPGSGEDRFQQGLLAGEVAVDGPFRNASPAPDLLGRGFAQAPFDPYRGEELQPGSHVTDDAAIDAFIRDKVETAYHPSCSCRMGRADDPMAVVDPETRVIGVEGLRVADASIMPSITTGNLNAPTIMLAEKASDHILGRTPLPPSNADFHVAGNWETAQR